MGVVIKGAFFAENLIVGCNDELMELLISVLIPDGTVGTLSGYLQYDDTTAVPAVRYHVKDNDTF